MTASTRLSMVGAAMLAACGEAPSSGTDTADEPTVEVSYASDYRISLSAQTLEGQDPFAGSPQITLWVQPPGSAPTLHLVVDRTVEQLPPLEAGTVLGLLVEDGGDANAWEVDRTIAYGQVLLREAFDLGGATPAYDVRVPVFADAGVLARVGGDDQRIRAGLAMLPDGRTYVFGGTPVERFNGGIKPRATRTIGRLDLADPSSASWDVLPEVLPEVVFDNDPDPVDDKRVALTATVFEGSDGPLILVAGGRSEHVYLDENTAVAHIFDPATEELVETLEMPYSRSEHVAVLMANGQVLLDGGLTNNVRYTTSAVLFDPDSRSFTEVELGDDIGGWRRAAASLGAEGVLICGGAQPSLFDDRADWDTTDICVRVTLDGRVVDAAPLPEPLAGHVLTPLADGRVLCTGGMTQMEGATAPADAVRSAWLYELSTDTWSAAGALSSPRAGHAVVPLPTGGAVVVGGVAGLGTLHNELTGDRVDCAERFDPSSNTFATLPSCPAVGVGADPTVATHPAFGAVVVGGLHLGATEATSTDAIGLVGFGPASP